jgi:hypothetical protein
MRELRTEIMVSSNPEKIWTVLMDLPGWATWNPIVTKIEGPLKIGAKLLITMCDESGKKNMSYESTITELDENKRFSFIGSMMARFMFSAERIFEIEEKGEGTQFIQREIYKGILVPIFWSKLNKRALPMLQSMNEALKRKVEN